MISPIQAMMPPSPPDLSMAALQAVLRSINRSGRDLTVPKVPVAPPTPVFQKVDLKA